MVAKKGNQGPHEAEEPAKYVTIGERLRYEREIHNWTQDELAEKLGTSTVSVSRWENNLHLPDIAYRKKLCELFKKSPLELGFVKESLEENGNSAMPADNLEPASVLSVEGETDTIEGAPVDPHTAENSRNQLSTWYASVIAEGYYALPQRELELQRLQAELQSPRGAPVVVIDGLGGLGKTSVALELARRLLVQQQFACVVGESAKLQLFTDEEIIPLRDATLDFDTLLNAIARQIGYWELLTFQSEKKQAVMAQVFKRQRHLVIVDNLETAENAQTLITQLHGVLNGSRAIVTSRNKVRHSFVYPLTLQKLDWKNASIFMQMEYKKHSAIMHMHPTEEDFHAIYDITGGAPLAIKLVISQTLTLDLDLILHRLKKAGSNLYFFIFHQSWEQLSTTAQHLLIYIGRTVMDTVSWEELSDAEITTNEEDLMRAVSQLVNASLLDVASSVSSHKQHRYSMHQLTRQFVCSELPDAW